MPSLKGKVAVVAGATRGAGRGIACMLGEAGATVYCTGRSTRAMRSHGKKSGSPFDLDGRSQHCLLTQTLCKSQVGYLVRGIWHRSMDSPILMADSLTGGSTSRKMLRSNKQNQKAIAPEKAIARFST
jgi:hypothetical protein